MIKRRKPMSQETKDKISKSKKGTIPWNKDKKGLQVSWLKGTKGLMKPNSGSFTSEKLQEKWQDIEYKKMVSEKISKSLKSKPKTEQHKQKLKGERPHTRGKNNSNWKGGYIDDRGHGKLIQYKLWRLEVFERDGFTCQDCRKRGGKLNAHHILTWKDFPEHRYDKWNGVTLCIECHRKTHKKKTANKLGTAT